ncbi:jg21998 [Pararge aegeria aegeria]|uniref:Jg21998 protein n=1 Tax=Pararge aegeria aegeria TaxID=348720 RepID=A0A8S4QRD2_9NEOP|nr:jg21998 [Pararge aegeria aegeria]
MIDIDLDHARVAAGALSESAQSTHLEAEAGVVAVRGRRPQDGGLLVAAQRHRQVGRRLGRCATKRTR